MESVKLPRTDIEVSRICVGSWQAKGWSSSDADRFVGTVRHAIDRGLNFIDTAPSYGDGVSEELVGRAIKGRRDKLTIATKCLARNRGEFRPSVEESLRRLGTDFVDILQQHWPTPGVAPEAALDEMEELKRQGKIRLVGVSNWMEPEWEKVKDPSRVSTLQPNHSLVWRFIERRVLPLCRKTGIGVLPYSPLCQGALAGRFRKADEVPGDMRKKNVRLQPGMLPRVLEIVDALAVVAKKYGKTTAQTALRWLLDQDGITAVIVGMSRPEQVDDNIGALGWKLDPADWKSLSDLSWPLSENLEPYDGLWTWHPMKSKR